MAFLTSGFAVRIRILRSPAEGQPWQDDELDLRPYQVGQIYDVGPRVAEYLILMGFAEPVTEHVRGSVDGTSAAGSTG